MTWGELRAAYVPIAWENSERASAGRWVPRMRGARTCWTGQAGVPRCFARPEGSIDWACRVKMLRGLSPRVLTVDSACGLRLTRSAAAAAQGGLLRTSCGSSGVQQEKVRSSDEPSRMQAFSLGIVTGGEF